MTSIEQHRKDLINCRRNLHIFLHLSIPNSLAAAATEIHYCAAVVNDHRLPKSARFRPFRAILVAVKVKSYLADISEPLMHIHIQKHLPGVRAGCSIIDVGQWRRPLRHWGPAGNGCGECGFDCGWMAFGVNGYFRRFAFEIILESFHHHFYKNCT